MYQLLTTFFLFLLIHGRKIYRHTLMWGAAVSAVWGGILDGRRGFMGWMWFFLGGPGWVAWDLVGCGGLRLVAILGMAWQLGTDGVAWIGGLGGVGSAQLVCILWRRFGGVGRVGRHIGFSFGIRVGHDWRGWIGSLE